MIHLIWPLLWCWLQAFVVAGLTLALAAAALRRSPGAGAALAWTGVVAVLALGVLAWIPNPTAALARRPAPAKTASRAAISDSPAIPPENDSAASFALNIERLRTILAPLQHSRSMVARYEIAGRVLIGVVAACALLSLARVAHGLWEIHRLYRHSNAVAETNVLAAMAELQPKIGLHWLPAPRECQTLASAAVVGWWRPVVMLPAGWREWSPAELQAALAHELAHVRRRDALVRLVAALVAALYCVQPLVQWLRRQLLLAQELAADELAARAVGSDAYLQALARLALRQDRRPIVAPAPLLLPVFSGFLLRRIDMLRAKDGSMRRPWSALLQGSAIVAIVVVALAAMGMRGLAEPPAARPDEPVRVAAASAVRPGPGDPAQGLFQRPRFDPATVAVRDSEAFILRVSDILRRPDLADQARELDKTFAAGWKEALGDVELAPWSLREIDYVAGDFHFLVKPMKQPTKDGSNQMMFGSRWWVVRWLKPLDGQFAALQRLPGAERKSHAGRDIAVLPVVPVIGPGNMCVTQLDDRTLLCSQSEKILIERLDSLAETAPPPPWRKTWDAVEGGLITLLATDKHVERPLGAPVDDEAKLYNELCTQVRSYAVGVDWQPQAGGVCVVMLQLGCDSEQDARAVQAAIRGIIDGQLKELAESGAADAEAERSKTYLQWLQKASLETRETGGSWHVNVQIACPLDAAALWQGL